ncbi:hypothetical protein E4U55_001297, partial [Claviceps digitariae]
MLVLIHLLGAENWLDFWKLFMEKNDCGAEEFRGGKDELTRLVLFKVFMEAHLGLA